MDEDISAVAMGELKAQYLPSKIKNRYIFAIGSGDTVSLYSLNNFTLKTY
jgi:DNA-binding transcriptional regulator LsrR (DeoR family)